MNRQRAGDEEGEGEGDRKLHAKTSPRNSPPAWTRPRKSGKSFFGCAFTAALLTKRARESRRKSFLGSVGTISGVGAGDFWLRCRSRRAFIVLTVYEVRDLLAQVPDGAEARRLAPYCFDTTDKATGQVAAVVGWLGHAAVEEWGWRKVDLRAGDAGALQSLRIITLLHRGSAEWYRGRR